MTVEYLDLADFIVIAQAVTGLDLQTVLNVTNIGLADSALHAPAAGFGDDDFCPDFVDKAAVLLVRLARNHPLPDGNKRAAWLSLRMFVDINGWDGSPVGSLDAMAVYTLPDLPYDYSALEPAISAAIIELHHGKHHNAYVTGANTVLEQLAEAREAGAYGSIVGLEKTLAFHLGGHALHSIYWTNLSPDGGDRPDGALGEAIDRDFGSFDKFRAHLTAATNTVQGSGWGALSYDSLGGRLLVEQIQDHQANHSPSTTPLLVFDIWEHAFYLQYKNVKADYVDALWTIVDWGNVATRFAAATRA